MANNSSTFGAQDSLAPCNETPYDRFSYFVRVTFMVPMLAFGFASNILNVVVFRHPSMRNSMVNWYLIALACSDFGVLFCSFCMLSFPVVSEEFDSMAMLNIGVYVQRWTYAFGLTSQTCSVGMLLLVSGHRFLGVRYPFVAQRLCTPERVKLAIIGALAFAGLFNTLRWFELDVDQCRSNVYNETGLFLIKSDLRTDHSYYVAYVVCTYTVVMFVVPFVLLIIMNAVIIDTVHRSYRLRQRLTNNTIRQSGSTTDLSTAASTVVVSPRDNNTAVNASSAKETKTTIMLIVIVFVFLFCNCLAFINNILEVILSELDTEGWERVSLQSVYLVSCEISNCLIVLNSSTNIFIYWMFSGKFRVLLKYYLYFTSCRRRANSARSGVTGDTTVLLRNGGLPSSSPRREESRMSYRNSVRKTTRELRLPPATTV